jgi:hypothetical protein
VFQVLIDLLGNPLHLPALVCNASRPLAPDFLGKL